MPNTRKNRKTSRKNKTQSGGKRKLSGYMKFANKHRKDVMKPGMKVPDIGRALGKKWRALSDAEKKSYAWNLI